MLKTRQILVILSFLILLNPLAIAKAFALHALPSSSPGASENLNYELTENQTGVTRNIIVEWMETQSGQDRFYPDFIIVNQWDTVHLTFINNDTVAHDFVIGSPYNVMVNVTVPGLYNDLTGKEFTTPATGNSPGVNVLGKPGNVSATYSFVAKYAGIFEYVCSYHAQVGMIGYLVVLANSTSSGGVSQSNTTEGLTAQNSTVVQVSIDKGAGTNVSLPGYTPTDITVVIGVNNTVRWTNNDNMPHTVSATDGSFDSGNMNAGDSFAHTFNETGTFAYICSYHHWMHGSVTVIGLANQQNAGASTGFETYGLVAVGIIVLVVILVAFSRSGDSTKTR
ncbi:MAG: cupredoxin domain-containing protein [Candidatus Bathyarchaeia archaeon]